MSGYFLVSSFQADLMPFYILFRIKRQQDAVTEKCKHFTGETCFYYLEKILFQFFVHANQSKIFYKVFCYSIVSCQANINVDKFTDV